ncbi:MAG: DUF1634 domain-containing protein [Myxococcaceae bacterium]|nr:DUF1634 domain-containing protein [Myxococcaceae bacterium]
MNVRVGVMVAAVVILAGALMWLRRERAPAPAPVRTTVVTSVPALEGRVVDEGGVPVAGAAVGLFAHAGLWLDDADAGACSLSALACDSLAAGRGVLAKLDAGALEFPAALASATTDSDGRFTLPRVEGGDGVAVNGTLVHLPASSPMLVQLAAPEPLTLSERSEGVAVTVINPFTRQVWRGVTDATGAAEPELDGLRSSWAMAEGSTVLLPRSTSRELFLGTPHPLEVQLEGGAPDGDYTLRCDHQTLRARSSAGVVRFDDVLGVVCALTGAAGDWSVSAPVVATGATAAVKLKPRARLRVTLRGAAVESATLLVLRPETAGLSALSRPLAEAHFEREAPAELGELELGPVRVLVRARGFREQVRAITLQQGVNEVTFTLEPGRSVRGTVQGGPGAIVTAWGGGDHHYLGWTRAADDGSFALDVEAEGPVELNAHDPGRGAAAVTVSGDGPVTLALEAATLVRLRAQRSDGRPASGRAQISSEAEQSERFEDGPVELQHDEGWVDVRFDDAGVARRANLKPGLHQLRIVEPGHVPHEGLFAVPDAGVVELTVNLEAGAVLMGRVRLGDAPFPGLDVEVEGTHVTSNRRGDFRFEGLRRGSHRLVVRDANGRTLEVDAGAPDVDFRVDLPP